MDVDLHGLGLICFITGDIYNIWNRFFEAISRVREGAVRFADVFIAFYLITAQR